MKKFFLLTSSLVLLNVAPVMAEEDNSARISEIEEQLKKLDEEREALAKELESLKGESGESSNAEVQTLETNDFTVGFSNARVEDNYLLVDMDFENTSNEAITLWTDLSFALGFEQEGDVEVYTATPTYTEKVGEVNGRKQVTMSTKIKAGAKAELLLVIDEYDPELPLIISSNMLFSDNPSSITLEIK